MHGIYILVDSCGLKWGQKTNGLHTRRTWATLYEILTILFHGWISHVKWLVPKYNMGQMLACRAWDQITVVSGLHRWIKRLFGSNFHSLGHVERIQVFVVRLPNMAGVLNGQHAQKF